MPAVLMSQRGGLHCKFSSVSQKQKQLQQACSRLHQCEDSLAACFQM